ncbi:MAG: hypothetical protein L7F78_08260, partial [Syntrophales bacterium LBB04]|nr:hypothetical protein [Syntrophales bacterium LBB04]
MMVLIIISPRMIANNSETSKYFLRNRTVALLDWYITSDLKQQINVLQTVQGRIMIKTNNACKMGTGKISKEG